MEWLTKEWDFASLERVDQGQRHHGNGRRVRRTAQGAPRGWDAKLIFVPYKYEMQQIETIAREIIPRLKS